MNKTHEKNIKILEEEEKSKRELEIKKILGEANEDVHEKLH